jgi:putative transposase
MRKSKFAPEQVAMVLRQAESGTPVSEICRKLEITENTFYRWRKKFGGMGTPEIRELRQLREEIESSSSWLLIWRSTRRFSRKALEKNGRLDAEARVGALGEGSIPALGETCLKGHWSGAVYDSIQESAFAACSAKGAIARAASRVSFGYQRLHVLLRREGWRVNHKLVLRLYREEGLMLKRQRPRPRKSATVRVERPIAALPNERWAMDFVHDTLIDGRSIRVLAVLDVFTRECVALSARGVFRGEDVARVLSAAGDARPLPQTINVDNGTEFTSRFLVTGRTGTK